MGREIRHVPKNWQHPVRSEKTWIDSKGNECLDYQPLHDSSYEEVANEWVDDCIAWNNSIHKDLTINPELKQEYPYWWDYAGEPPNKIYYRPTWTEVPTAFQVYETVSEGTPISPVFETTEQLKEWLIQQGYSEDTAKKFIEWGSVPSFIISGGRLYENIDTINAVTNKDDKQ